AAPWSGGCRCPRARGRRCASSASAPTPPAVPDCAWGRQVRRVHHPSPFGRVHSSRIPLLDNCVFFLAPSPQRVKPITEAAGATLIFASPLVGSRADQ